MTASRRARDAPSELARLVRDKRVIVCTGAGGVGKTSVAAAMALAAARMGRRVLVVTIDPSRRLAEALGVDRNPPHPESIDAERLAELGVEGEGSLAAWMLDPMLVSNRAVRRLARSDRDAERLLNNSIYRNVTSMVAGMQEYTAVEALHEFIRDDAYDLVILDTPPSRNALSFLDAPERAGRFLDKRIFSLFVPGEGNVIRRAASRLLGSVMNRVFGSDVRRDLQVFFQLFGSILSRLHGNAAEMRRFFSGPEVAFLVVTSPEREALEEAGYFETRTREILGLDMAGYVLNRSMAFDDGREPPAEAVAADDLDDVTRSALEKLAPFAEREQEACRRHREVLDRLRERTGLAVCLPNLSSGVNDLSTLALLADALVSEP